MDFSIPLPRSKYEVKAELEFLTPPLLRGKAVVKP